MLAPMDSARGRFELPLKIFTVDAELVGMELPVPKQQAFPEIGGSAQREAIGSPGAGQAVCQTAVGNGQSWPGFAFSGRRRPRQRTAVTTGWRGRPHTRFAAWTPRREPAKSLLIMKIPAPILPAGLVALMAIPGIGGTQDWPHWRGPNFNGSAVEQKVPQRFNKSEGVAWSAAMPGDAASTPVVAGRYVFLTSADATTRGLMAFALDRESGKEVWRVDVAEGDRKDRMSNYASPSPATDGRLVWFLYGQGDLLACTVDGKEVWRRNLQKDYGEFAYQWTYGASPTLFQDRLYIQVLQRNVPVNGHGRTDGGSDSYLLALDPGTGKELWRHVRPSEARQESLEAYSTPIPYSHENRTELLISGGDCITGHDPETGRELWRWGTWNPQRITDWRLVPSPVGGAGMILACGPKGSPVFAIKAGQNGTLPESGYAWRSDDRELSTDVSTPLFYRDRFFVLNSDRKMLLCVEPATGKVLWKGDLPGGKFESSPTAADGKVFAISMTGHVVVVGAGDHFELLHDIDMGDENDRQTRSSIAIADGHLFIRTARTLYAVGPTG